MKKSEVYSWRVAPETKMALEAEARREGRSVAALLDRMAREWLTARRRRGVDIREHARVRASAEKVLGTIAGGDPRRAERARTAIRERLSSRRRGR